MHFELPPYKLDVWEGIVEKEPFELIIIKSEIAQLPFKNILRNEFSQPWQYKITYIILLAITSNNFEYNKNHPQIELYQKRIMVRKYFMGL